MSDSAIKVGEKSQGGEGGQGHWVGLEEYVLEMNMGKFKFGGRQRYIIQGDGTMEFS